MIVAKSTLIMVLDGARSALFRNTGPALFPELEPIESADDPAPSPSEPGTDLP